MSFELNNELIQIYKPLKTAKVKCIMDTDIIVPDTKPDVVNILQVNAISAINEKYIQKDMITVSGFVDFTILYSGGNETIEIKNIKYKAPFTQQIEINGINNEMINYVISDVSHIDYYIQNSRKLNIKTALSFDTGVIGKTSVDAVSSIVSTLNIPSKNEEIKLLNMSVFEDSKFSVSDIINISQSVEQETEILKIDCHIENNELKTVNNKAIVKGNLNADILYTIDGDICRISNEIPFTEVIDVENITPQMHTEIRYNLCSVDFDSILEDEFYKIDFRAEIEVFIQGYEEKTYDILTDVYSPDYEMELSKNEYEILSIQESRADDFTVNEAIVLKESNPSIIKVYNLTEKPVIEAITPQKGHIITDGYLDTKILYLTNDENLPVYSCNVKIPFSFKTENSSITETSIADITSEILHSSYILKSERQVDIRCGIRLSTKILSKSVKTIISDISLDESETINKNNQSGITIYFCDENENLWDVAKRYKTTCKEIAQINEIDENTTLRKRQQLLIPKRVII